MIIKYNLKGILVYITTHHQALHWGVGPIVKPKKTEQQESMH